MRKSKTSRANDGPTGNGRGASGSPSFVAPMYTMSDQPGDLARLTAAVGRLLLAERRREAADAAKDDYLLGRCSYSAMMRRIDKASAAGGKAE